MCKAIVSTTETRPEVQTGASPFLALVIQAIVLPLSFMSSPCCCVFDTNRHVAKSPGHLSALYCPNHSTAALTALVGRDLFVASLSVKQVSHSKKPEPASPQYFVSVKCCLMCSFRRAEMAAKEDANNHLKNKNIPLQLVKDKL